MTRPLRRIVNALLVAALTGGLVLAAAPNGLAQVTEKIPPRPVSADATRAEDEKAIRAAGAAMRKAFNAGDAKAVAALFTPDADYVDDQGQEFQGRAAIEKEFALSFARKKGMTIEVTDDSLRFVSKDVAIKKGVVRVRGESGTPANAARFAAVLVRQGNQWLVESIRESPYVPSCNYEYLSDLEWMIGGWTAQTGTVTVEMTCAWAANRNFILRTFTVKGDGNTLSTGTQVIGWDPLLGRLRSWSFDSDGGFGSELWTRDKKAWVLDAGGVRREGQRTSAKNILTPGDIDTFTWQSKERLLEGAKLPDTAEVKFVRVKAKP